jgi:hypothetical protein
MNDTERAQWVDNDEGLYLWRRRTRLSMRAFIRTHRAEIDNHIKCELADRSERKPRLTYTRM